MTNAFIRLTRTDDQGNYPTPFWVQLSRLDGFQDKYIQVNGEYHHVAETESRILDLVELSMTYSTRQRGDHVYTL